MNANGALVFLVLLLVVIGLVAGLALSNSDLINPYRNRAEAERIRQEAAIQAQREAIDIQTYQREQELHLQALEQQQADERAYRQALWPSALSLRHAIPGCNPPLKCRACENRCAAWPGRTSA